jgi:DNA-binding SARP family transcriptional activator
MNRQLTVRMFGKLQLSVGQPPNQVKLPHAVQNLLAYLLLFRHRDHARETLIEVLWPGLPSNRARNCLNTALWRLRTVLEPSGIPRGTYLNTTNAEIGFNGECHYWLDTVAFESTLLPNLKIPIEAAAPDDIRALEDALPLYSADLLDSIYGDWVAAERARYRELYLTTLQYVMSYHVTRHNHQDALRLGQQIAALDPLQEEAHRNLMRLYLNRGEVALAIRQYRQCCHMLETELGCLPTEETQALYRSVVGGEQQDHNHTPRKKAPETMAQALSLLSKAMSRLEQADHELREAMQVVRQMAAQEHQ